MQNNVSSSPWHGTVPSDPELYDFLHKDHDSDISLYRRLSAECSAVLECGIGTGRIAIPLARAGVVVHGIDTSPEMLATLQRKLKDEPGAVRERVHAHQADMCSFDLGLRFRLIYVPFMTFNYLPNIAAQLACLRSVCAHLDEKGMAVFELMSFYREWFYDDGVPRFVMRRADPVTGVSTEVFRVTRFDPATQIVEHDRHYRFLDSSGHVQGERIIFLRNRFFFLGEASLLFEKAGLCIRHVWGDHAGGPYVKESQVMILVAFRGNDVP